MAEGETGRSYDYSILDQSPEPEGPPQGLFSSTVRFLVYTTFGIAFLFLIIGIAATFSPSWGAAASQTMQPYFFILLLAFVIPSSLPIMAVFVLLFALYLVFFVSITYETRREKKRELLDTPMGYFIVASTAMLVAVTTITLVEMAMGTQIGGQGIDTSLQQNPLLGYMSLIYAPFVEELGFRILPLGIFSYFLVRSRTKLKQPATSLRDSLVAIVLPGHVRKKYGIRFGAWDWILIVITSVIFGYAHIFFGAWDWGKFLPVFITGIGLAIGFLKFGAYVDIPLHWFFNGFLTVYYLNASLTGAANFLTLWLLGVGVVSIFAITGYAMRHAGRGSEPAVRGV